MRVAFTGHRPEQLNIQQDELSQAGQALQDLIWQEIWTQEKAGADTFLCGGAKGADIICGELILAEKQTTNPQLTLICAIPFREHAERWSFDWKLRYHELLKGADKIVQVCDTYQRGCFHMAITTGGRREGHGSKSHHENRADPADARPDADPHTGA